MAKIQMKKTADAGSIENDKIGLYPNADGNMCIKDEDGNVKVLATTDEIPPEPTIPTDINQLTDEDTLLKMEDDNFTDWFLPSRGEVAEMYTNLHAEGVGSFDNAAAYLTSSEKNATDADFIKMSSGGPVFGGKGEARPVRPARKFTS